MSKEELKIKARKRALQVLKNCGGKWFVPGVEFFIFKYHDEYNRILEELIKEEIKKENEVNEQGG